MEEYIPTCLRKDEPKLPRKVLYGIGQDDGRGGYGIWCGPVCFEETVLETVGQDNNSVIIRFNVDDVDRVIWRWKDDRWVAVGKIGSGRIEDGN